MATITGTAGNDTLEGTTGNDVFDAGPGNDEVRGSDGSDTVLLSLGGGRDYYYAWGGIHDLLHVQVPLEDVAYVQDTVVSYGYDWSAWRYFVLIDGTTTTEVRRVSAELDLFLATDTGVLAIVPGNRGTLVGSDASELFSAAAANNRLEGRGGDDVLYANGGPDVVLGGSGDDYVSAGFDDAQDDWLDGEDGTDTVSYSGANGYGITIDIGRSYASGDSIGFDRVFNFEAAIGSSGNDVLIGRDGAGDTLRGYWGNDWLYAGAADDMLVGGHGNDVLLGESDDDTLDGSEGDDWLYGGSGSNSLSGGWGVDVLISQGGNDTLSGGEGDDHLYGYGSGITFAAGDAGNDIFVMQSGAGLADGGDGQDYFYMGAGADTMRGGAGVDVLLGGGGNDVFEGGTGTDYLFLGAGNSVVVFRPDSGADVVNGFKAEGSQHAIRFEDTRFASIDDILAATYDFNGDALIRLDSDTVVWLVGVARSQLSGADFAIA